MAKVPDKAGGKLATIPERRPPQVALDWDDTNKLTITLSGDLDRLASATGNADVQSGFVGQLSILGSHSRRTDNEAANFALGIVDSMRPRDPAEALLTAQMAAIHQATMMLARRLDYLDNIAQQDAAERG